MEYAVSACQNGDYVRGQRLFIRPIDPSDDDAIRGLFSIHDPARNVPSTGLIGKLVGELVAVVAFELLGDAIRIDDVFVVPELRRKRVGRFMLDEAASLARKLDRTELIVTDARGAEAFLARVGFTDADGQWRRRT